MNLNTLRATAVAALLFPLAALAGSPVDVEILDRKTGRVLPVYWHEGERHIAGEPGHEYEIRLRNQGHGRVLAVTSVDGINVITGRTASPDQSGYVVDPYGRVEIDGWRKSMDEVAAFYFTALPDSYAARTGRPDNVGVIGVALFCERRLCAQCSSANRATAADAAAAAARKSAGGLGAAPARSPASAPATASASIPAPSTRSSSARAKRPTKSFVSTTTRAATSSPAA